LYENVRTMAIHVITRRPLSQFVEFLWLAEGYTQPHAAERVLPTGRMGLVLNLDGDSQVGNIVAGARTSSMILDTSRPLSLLGVGFRPGGGFPFFRLPAGELQDLSLSLETLWGRGALILREQLLQAKGSAARFEILERALMERLKGGPGSHPAVQFAVRAFQDRQQSVSVGSVVEQTGLTARRFIDVFRDQVGLTPKVFARIARFRHLIGSLESSKDVDWSATALQCGYFDQAHFIHDFRSFAGLRPSDYLRYRTSTNHVRIPDQ
jgi:AraC-like DNA-binding protein